MRYPKTESPYVRDEETHLLVPGIFRRPDFAQIGRWLVTEKIDGTNIRVILNGHLLGDPVLDGPVFASWDVRGRSDDATLPKRFVEEAFPHVSVSLLESALNAIEPMRDPERGYAMVVYGEGYGAGIQKGACYSPTKQLRIFDVLTFKEGSRSLWRTWNDVVEVARVLGLSTVPVVWAEASLAQVRLCVGDYSRVAQQHGMPPIQQEGVVARTDPYLYDYRGNRVMFKLKSKDLA